jgi:hypothetical protein
VKSTVAKFPSEFAVSVHESQNAFSDPKVACPIAYMVSGEYQTFRNSGTPSARIYGHNEKCM